MADEGRRQLHGWVSPESLKGWRDFASAHSTNVTALLEVLGRTLRELEERPTGKLPPLLRDLVAESRRVAGERSARRGTLQDDIVD